MNPGRARGCVSSGGREATASPASERAARGEAAPGPPRARTKDGPCLRGPAVSARVGVEGTRTCSSEFMWPRGWPAPCRAGTCFQSSVPRCPGARTARPLPSTPGRSPSAGALGGRQRPGAAGAPWCPGNAPVSKIKNPWTPNAPPLVERPKARKQQKVFTPDTTCKGETWKMSAVWQPGGPRPGRWGPASGDRACPACHGGGGPGAGPSRCCR